LFCFIHKGKIILTFAGIMATILITGGTGLIGTALTRALLAKGFEVIILSRNPSKAAKPRPGTEVNITADPLSSTNLSYAAWNIEEQTIDTSAVSKADYIIHLAGAGVADKRWTTKRKKEIVESRTHSSSLLVKALKENTNRVKAVISASGIGWYGSPSLDLPEEKGTEKNPFTETDPAADDFLGTTCREWEASIDPVTSLGKRLVKFRTGIVLSNEGGALKEFRKPLRFGVAAILGNGRQVMSWIHIDDLVHLYMYAVENENLQGVYNAVAPQTVTNKKFTLQLAGITRGRFFVPVYVPSFILEIVLGDMSVEVLKSATVSCEKIKKEGFTFLHPSVKSAFLQLNKSV
jgi:uncharacterized protein